MTVKTIPGFDEFSFAAQGMSHRVFRKGTGPAVLLMHELPGMVPSCISLGEEIVRNRFSAYLPLFFGEPGDHATGRFLVQICIHREIYLLAKNGGSPIVDWLRALCQKIWSDCGGLGVGVIGLCMSGNFAISLMAEESVIAPVASEPALPLLAFTHSRKEALAVTPAERAGAVRRCIAGQPIMALRFSGDAYSPAERFATLRTCFGPKLTEIEIDSSPGNPWAIRPGTHSVLTSDFRDEAGHPTRKARDEVIGFLRERLLSPA
jgi:dienelactone hydrolase